MKASKTLLRMKFARIVNLYAKEENIPITEALDRFYRSKTYVLMRDGVADMHCMSDQYLVDELRIELTGATD